MDGLYEISDDTERASEQFLERYGDPQDNIDGARSMLLADVQILLVDDFVHKHVIRNIAAFHRALPSGWTNAFRAPLGLYLGLSAATAASVTSDPSSDNFRAAAGWLEDDGVRECLADYYELTPRAYDLGQAELHRVGTTSLILRCRTRVDPPAVQEEIALKCLLPRYRDVHAISVTTAQYKDAHRINHVSVPNVRESKRWWIAMDFVEGDTLAEVLAARAVPDFLQDVDETNQDRERAKRRALKGSDIAFIRDLGYTLCNILGDLTRRGHRHLDLSPSNIIVVRTDPWDVRLIDFGHNFAITERVGSSAAFRRAALYVAPELIDDPSLDDWRCDAYSLGVILLEAAAKRRLDKERLGGELDRLWQGDLSWDGAPGLARIVEDLLDSSPDQRLALMDDGTGGSFNPYEYLGKLIKQETEVLRLYEERTSASGFGLLHGFGLVKLWRNAQLMNLFETVEAVEDPVDDAYVDFPKLARWAAIAIACWAIVLTSFVTLTLADLIPGFSPLIEPYIQTVHPPFTVGDFWENFLGRIVPLTFSITAVTYYVNNFSTLSPRRIRSRLGRASEFAMRATAVGLTFPIMWAMVWDPQAWPLCAGLGTLLVVANNFLALRVAREANAVGNRFSTRGDSGKRFTEDVFSEWWALMCCYSISMIAIGVLLIVDVAHDEKVFAVLAVIINVAKMYRLNCVRNAPQVRGCLSRDILTMRRAHRLDERGVPPPGVVRKPDPHTFSEALADG